MTRKVVCFVMSSQNLARKVLVKHWLLRLLIGPICCIFHQFQWIAYNVYHLICHLARLLRFWVKCQLELNKRPVMTKSCFKRGKQLPLLNPYGNPNPATVVGSKSASPG